MLRTSIFLIAAAAAAAIAQPAGAQAPAATLAVDQECYSPGDTIHWTGTGYTPNSSVDVLMLVNGQLGGLTRDIGPDGSLDVPYDVTYGFVNDFLAPGQASAPALSTAVPHGSTTVPDDAPTASFTLSRFDIQFGRLRAGRAATFTAYGFTHSQGRTLYVHFVRGGNVVKVVKVGTLDEPCGDASRRIAHAVPKKTGKYKLYFSTSRTNAKGGEWSSATARVRP